MVDSTNCGWCFGYESRRHHKRIEGIFLQKKTSKKVRKGTLPNVALLLVMKRRFMNITSKLSNKLSKIIVFLVWIINALHRIKRPWKEYYLPFWGLYVKQFVINGRICGQTVGFFTAIMRRHIPIWLQLNFRSNTEQKALLCSATILTRFHSLRLFPISETQISQNRKLP